jgi:putative acyl-CoA dehydrogenase
VRSTARRDDPGEAAYMRLLTPAIKYWVCKSAPGFLYEAMECLGGNGYVEEGILARHFRESPVNAIWEGSGNVMCLDVLRAAGRHAEASMDTLARLVRTASQAFNVGPLALQLERTLKSPDAERRARFLCEGLARIASLAALVEAKSGFAALYGDARLGANHGQFGTADLGGAEAALMERAFGT